MKVKSEDFVSAFTRTSLGKQRTTLPILGYTLLEAQCGKLTVRQSNLDAYTSATVDCKDDLPGECVPTATLERLLKRANGTVTLEHGKRLVFSSGNDSAELPTLLAKEFPEWPKELGKLQGVSLPDLVEGLEAVEWAAANKELLDNIQTCVWVKTEAKRMFCAATDKCSYGLFERHIICAEMQFLISAGLVKLLVAALKQPEAQLFLSDKMVGCQYKGGAAIFAQRHGPYLPIEQIYGMKREPIGELPRKDTLAALAVCASLYPEKFAPTKFELSEKGCVISSTGVSSFKTKLMGKFKPASFSACAVGLSDCLNSFNLENVKLFLEVGGRGVFMQDGDYTSARVCIQDRK